MRTNFRDVGRQKGEMFGDARAELLDFASVRFEVREGKLLSLILELKFRIRASK